MKKFLFLLALLFFEKFAKAQNEYLDTNFANFLKTKFPSCIIYHNPNDYTYDPGGYTIDASCTAITNLDSLDIHGLNISNLAGIEDFTSLTYLNCSGNQIYTSPALPNSLTYLDMSSSKPVNGAFGYMLPLPGSLIYFDCSNYGQGENGAQFYSLPNLPTSLMYLKCANVGLNYFPSLPNSLIYLDCSSQIDNTLTSSPRSLKALPQLPNSLTYLNCANNAIAVLPSLPNSLTYLDCSGMEWYDINYVYSSTLFCLPKLPDALTFLSIPNSVNCLPNLVTGLQIRVQDSPWNDDTGHLVSSFPLCGNSSSCTTYPSDIILCSPVTDTINLISGSTGVSYQWQLSTDSVNFSNINNGTQYNGVNTDTLKLDHFSSSFYGYQYRCIVDGNNSNVYSLKFTDTWTGAIDSIWENPSNWSCGNVPDINTDVFINSGTAPVVLSSNESVRSITVNPNTSFTIVSPYTLRVTH